MTNENQISESQELISQLSPEEQAITKWRTLCDR